MIRHAVESRLGLLDQKAHDLMTMHAMQHKMLDQIVRRPMNRHAVARRKLLGQQAHIQARRTILRSLIGLPMITDAVQLRYA